MLADKINIDHRKVRVEAYVDFEEAREKVAVLVFTLRQIGKRSARIAALLEEVTEDSNLSELPSLTPADYEGIDYETIRGLVEALAEARRELVRAREIAIAVGCRV